MENNHFIFQGDCLEIMNELIANGIKVDAIICDIPYGSTNNSWDSIIPFDKMWECLKQIRKNKHTPILLFADDPFAAYLQLSNPKWYRYKWFWNKKIATGFLDSAWKPLKVIEQILVFIERPFQQIPSQESWKKYDRIAQYYPQYEKGQPNHNYGNYTSLNQIKSHLAGSLSSNYKTGFKTKQNIKATYTHKTTFYRDGLARIEHKDETDKNPKNLIEFSKVKPNKYHKMHPTEKPVELLEYLVKTYSQENEIVLDFTAGSGSLMEACYKTNRISISIEINSEYCNDIKNRLDKLQNGTN